MALSSVKRTSADRVLVLSNASPKWPEHDGLEGLDSRLKLYQCTHTIELRGQSTFPHGHQHQRDRRRADLSPDRQPGQVLSGIRAAPAWRRAPPHPDAGAAAEGDAEHDREGVR